MAHSGTALALTALLCAALVFSASIPIAPNRQYAKAVYGIEVIDFNAPTLAYISNLQADLNGPKGTPPRIWFTADKSSPNAYYAQFDPLGTLFSFCLLLFGIIVGHGARLCEKPSSCLWNIPFSRPLRLSPSPSHFSLLYFYI